MRAFVGPLRILQFFFNMDVTPPPFNNVKKTAILVKRGIPKCPKIPQDCFEIMSNIPEPAAKPRKNIFFHDLGTFLKP